MANVSYKEQNSTLHGPKLITFYKDNVQLGSPSSGIKHPEEFVKVLETCSALSQYEIAILTDLILESSL
jgi:hypothetical protein